MPENKRLAILIVDKLADCLFYADMPATEPIHLDPRVEGQFLDTLLLLMKNMLPGANGKQLAVIGHYQEELETRKTRVASLLEQRAEMPKARRRK